MAENTKLSQCKTCKGTVSKNAKVCPHCGEKKPVPKNVSPITAWGLIFMAVLVGVIQLGGGASTTSSSTSGDYTNKSKQIAWIETSKDGVRNKLKDPKSAQFKDEFFAIWKDTPVTCGRVNSKNSMGGYGGFQRFVAAGTTVVYLEEEVADFANVWKEICKR